MASASWLRQLNLVWRTLGRGRRARVYWRPWLERLEDRLTPAPLTPVAKDATLFSESPTFSDGAGGSIYVGKVSTGGQGALRRALLEFDLSKIPAGAVVTSATLTLDLLKVPLTGGGIVDVSLYRLDQDWGEGKTSSIGKGAPANPGDATWSSAMYQQQAWVNPIDPTGGGNYESTASATTTVDGTRNANRVPNSLGPKTWSDPQMVADLNGWLADPSTNFGWLIKSKEDVIGTALEFGSNENPDTNAVPKLDITYRTTPAITVTDLPAWTVNQPYPTQTIQVTGGATPYVFAAVGPIHGLSLSADGQVSGTPTADPGADPAAAFDISIPVNVTDNDGHGQTAPPQTFTVHVNPAPVLVGFTQTPDPGADPTLGAWRANQVETATLQVVGGTFSSTNPPVITGLPSVSITGDSATTLNGVTTHTYTITCVPTSASNVTLSVTDYTGAIASHAFPVSVSRAAPRIFVVNTTADLLALRPNDPACDEEGDISLRSALEASDDDAIAGEPQRDTIILLAGDYALDSPLFIHYYANIQNAIGVSPEEILITASTRFVPFASSFCLIQLTGNGGAPGVASITGVEFEPGPLPADHFHVHAVQNDGNLTLNKCVVENFQTSAIVSNAELQLDGCTFANNSNFEDVIYSYYTFVIIDPRFDDAMFTYLLPYPANAGAGEGGAILERSGSVMVNDCTFVANHAGLGGAIYAGAFQAYDGMDLTITNSSFVSNFAVVSGGAIFNAGNLTASGNDFRLNTAQLNTGLTRPLISYSGGGDGGAVYSTVQSMFSSNNNTYEQNFASGDGGAIYSEAAFAQELVSRGDTFSANSANRGGAIANTGTMIVSGSAFENNFNMPLFLGPTSAAGAIFNIDLNGAEASAVFDNSLFMNNVASGNGGAIGNYDHLSVRNSLFEENRAALGGAICNHGFVTITNSTLTNNAATTSGGAVWNDGYLTADACTLVFNEAENSGGGVMSVFLSSLGATTLIDDILLHNDQVSDGGQENDVDGSAISPDSSYNLVGDDATGSLADGTNGNHVVPNPGVLGSLGYYGGATPTYPLTDGSGYAIHGGGPVTTLSDDVPIPGADPASIIVSNGAVFAATALPPLTAGSYFTIQIDDEQMAVTAVQINPNGSATLTVTRMSNSTTGDGHAAGSSVWLASDQRGLIKPATFREQGSIGAFQTTARTLVNSTGDENGEGIVTLRDAVNMAEQPGNSGFNAVDFDPIVFATPQTIRLDADLTFTGHLPFNPAFIVFLAPSAGVTITGGLGAGGSVSGIEVAAGAAVRLEGNLSISAPLSVSASMDDPSAPGPLAAGLLTVDGHASLDLFGIQANINGTLMVEGSLVVDRQLTIGASGLLQVDAGSGGATINGFLTVFGRVNIEHGSTDVDGNPVPAASLTVVNNVTIEPNGVLSDAGAMSVGSATNHAATLNDFGTVIVTAFLFNGANQFQPGGSLDLFGQLTVEPSQLGSLSGILLGSPAGTLDDLGDMTVESGATLRAAGSVTVGSVDTGGTMDVYGTVIIPGAIPGSTTAGLLSVVWQVSVHAGLNGAAAGQIDNFGQVIIAAFGQINSMGTFTAEAGSTVADQGSFRVQDVTGLLTVAASSTFTVANAELRVLLGGQANILGSLTTTNSSSRVSVEGGSTFSDRGQVTISGALDVATSALGAGTFLVAEGSFSLTAPGTVTVEGDFHVRPNCTATVGGRFTVAAGGTVEDEGGILVIGSAGVLNVAAASNGLREATVTLFTSRATLSLGLGARATIAGSLFDNGDLEVQFGSSLTDTGRVEITTLAVGGPAQGFAASSFTVGSFGLCTVLSGGTATVGGNFNVLGGALTVDGAMTVNALVIGQGSNLDGVGTIIGPVTVKSGAIVAPGNFGVGTLGTGNLTLNPGSILFAVLRSSAPFAYGQANVTGAVNFDGATLELTAAPGFSASEGDQYILVNNDGTEAVSGSLLADAGADALTPGTPLHDGDLLSTNFLDTGRRARVSYHAGPGANSVGILLSPLAPTIDTSPSDPATTASAAFTFSDADPRVSFLTTLDQGAPALSSGSATYANLAPGSHTFTVVAFGQSGFVSAPATYTWTVGAPPIITSVDAAAFQAGSPSSFTIMTTGFPTPTLSEIGDLPPGITFIDQQDGTAVLSGAPAPAAFGTFSITITAGNGSAPDATQPFTLTISNLSLPTAGQVLSVPSYLPIAMLPALSSGATPVVSDVTAFTVSQVAPGGSATVVIQLPAGTLQPGTNYAYFKYDPAQPAESAWVRTNPGIATFDVDAQTITLQLTDDGVVADGDEGAADDGVIVDPGLPVTLAKPKVSVSDGGGVYRGSAFPAVATVAGTSGVYAATLEGMAPVLDYQQLDGNGNVFADLHGQTPTTAGSYRVVATFPGSLSYTSALGSATFTIARATPTIVWAAPPPITYLTPLAGGQLNATATWFVGGSRVPIVGTFAYNPPAGTLLAPGTRTLSTTFTPADGADFNAVTASVPLTVLGPGVAALGSVLYVVGGATSNDQIQISPTSMSTTGSTGLQVVATLNRATNTSTYNQTFAAINIVGFAGNINVQLADTLAVTTSVTLGNGNDNVQLGNGNNVVTLGNGNDNVQLGDGSNRVTLGNGNDNVQVGNGDNLIVAGDGNDNLQAGNGNNLIVGGLGQHTIQVGDGRNILIDGSVRLTQASDSLAQLLADWVQYGATPANVAGIRARLLVTYNNSRANTLTAGSGLDWFWATYAKDLTNRKTNDLVD